MAEILNSAVAPNGDVFVLEIGGRIVRCGNPLTGERTAELVYAGKERLDGLCVSPDGSLHAVGTRYHTNAGGVWRKERVPRANEQAELVCVWAPSADDVWVGTENEVLRRGPAGWTASSAGLTRKQTTIFALGGSSPNDVYAVGGQVTHFDGETWTPVAMPAPALYLGFAKRGETSFIVGRNGANLFAGSGTTFRVVEGVKLNEKTGFFKVAAAGDDLYIATGQELLLWDGKTTRVVQEGSGYDVSTNGTIVATSTRNGIHVLFEGEWQFLPSGPKTTDPDGAPAPAAKKKKAAAPKL